MAEFVTRDFVMRKLSSLKSIFMAVAMVFGAAGAQAQDMRPPTVDEDIKTLPTEGEYAEIRDTLELCISCHGLNSASAEPGMPVLSGQHQYYIYVQLKDFKRGRRTSEIMQGMVEDLEKDEMMLIGKFFSEQHWPKLGYRGDPEKVERGEVAADSGECTACHLGNYEGNSRVPHIAGQQKEYLIKTMMDLKNRDRKNAAVMADLFASYSDEDIEAMAEFMADF